MRTYDHIDRYLDQLAGDIYDQAPDAGHQQAIEDTIDKWIALINPEHRQHILDIGCAQGQAIPVLQKYAQKVEGVTLGQDVAKAVEKGYQVRHADMTFLPYDNNSVDLLFARHVLEHSPMPLLTLMEWRRVCRHYLFLIVPDYDHYGTHGVNHYYVLLEDQWKHLFSRAGWEVIWEDTTCLLETPFEWRWMLRKK